MINGAGQWGRAAYPISGILGTDTARTQTALEWTFGFLPSVLGMANLVKIPRNFITRAVSCVKTTTSYFGSKTTQTGGGKRVYIHDTSASTAIVIAYLMVEYNITYEQALQHVKTQRSCCDLKEIFEKGLQNLDIAELRLQIR
ncbi:MAG: hypothetical protein K940chlam8_00417 [Chlamydiae bacterium]|nr:hypothetical protein [Chlamydiota bacterium]